jgi:hypothetical protein
MSALKPRALQIAFLLLSLTILSSAQQPEPRINGQRSLPNSVILGGGNHAATMQRLRVVRKYALSDIRGNPRVTLGEAKLDFRPMLNNPKALFNVAQRLHTIPQHVQVQEDSSEASEVEQGLVIHHTLTYRVLPGKCGDPNAKAQMAQAGIECFARTTTNQRLAEFSQPGSARYVADPRKRQAAIAAFQRNSALNEADANKHIADLRKAFVDPAQHAKIVGQIGQAEATRISNLSDDQLEEEVINSSVQHFEETTFVPKVESANYAHPKYTLRIAPSSAEVAAGQELLRDGVSQGGRSNFPQLVRVVPASAFHTLGGVGGNSVSDIDLGTYIYLTGFTLGHDYEWSMEVDTTINWCIFGCSSTYSVKVYAGFNYGFGLRFPIQTELKYHNAVQGNSDSANLTAIFKPINGSAADFASTGLESDQIFDGKELVAQVGADAGFNFNLPVIGSGGDGISVGIDFTDLLPAPYTHGHFLPPAPGSHGIDTPFIFDQIDLLGGLLNFGVVGGQVFPATNINLHSNKLEFTLNDEILKKQTRVTSTGQVVPVSVKGNDSHFSFGNPVYNLGFTLTPGIDARLFVDVAVWSHHWDWPVWFPQLAVDLPPHGADFSCHAGTTCVLDFQPEREAHSGVREDLEKQGCTTRGSEMTCTKLQTYYACEDAVKQHTMLGIQSCNGSLALKEEESADRTLTGGGCQRNNGRIGNYLCPLKGMLGLCKTMLSNGAVLSCEVLVPTSTDQILRREGCTGEGGVYVCPSGMMGLCNDYAKNGVILSCKQK